MQSAQIYSVVRLKQSIPTLGLQCGDVGVVVNIWLPHAGVLFEVEFPQPYRSPVRTLLHKAHMEVLDPQIRDAA